MESSYFKRFRMDVDLSTAPAAGPFSPGWQLAERTPPAGYRLVEWNEALLDVHARTKHRCFRGEIDAMLFPCLGSLDGCRRLMHEIRGKPGFLAAATWLVAWGRAPEDLQWCGTIQGVIDRTGLGSIQNIGIVPGHRGRGLGTSLIAQALAGFRQSGVRRAFLEVTVENTGALRLYQRLGFRRTRTVYKAVDGFALDAAVAEAAVL